MHENIQFRFIDSHGLLLYRLLLYPIMGESCWRECAAAPYAAMRMRGMERTMNHLTRNDYANALRLLAHLEPESVDLERFARASVGAVANFVASEVTTLSICDLGTGHRRVVGQPGCAWGPLKSNASTGTFSSIRWCATTASKAGARPIAFRTR